jgi:hypothetical protein
MGRSPNIAAAVASVILNYTFKIYARTQGVFFFFLIGTRA